MLSCEAVEDEKSETPPQIKHFLLRGGCVNVIVAEGHLHAHRTEVDAIFRVRAGAPGPLQMRRARSAINFGGVNAF